MPNRMAEKDRVLSQRLHELLEPAVASAGCDLEEVTSRLAGRRRLVTVLVDRDGGIDLDAVAHVSRVVDEVLDTPQADALLEGAYVLEVSSPGVDRPLMLPRHWRRARTRLVTVTLAGESITGRVITSDEVSATLEVDGVQRTISLSDVSRAVVQVEFRSKNEGRVSDTDADGQ
jgi:ribosome maturation factor RimP